MSNLRKAAQQALEALVLWEDEAPHAWSQADENAVAALRAALAEQDRGPGWCPIHQHYKPCEHNTAAQAQPLTIERLRDALVASRIIDPGAVEDPDDYDDGVTLHRIEALYRRLG